MITFDDTATGVGHITWMADPDKTDLSFQRTGEPRGLDRPAAP